MNDFVHLRVSSEYSIFKGLPSPKKLAAEAAKQSMPMLALTDQSNMFGAVKFFSECEKKGVKPISGTVLKIFDNNSSKIYEILCLAKNKDGQRNLMHLISKSSANLIENVPCITFAELCDFKNNIFIFSGANGSDIFSLISQNQFSLAEKTVENYLKYFGDNFNFEIQNINNQGEKDVADFIFSVSSHKGIPVVATNDVLFLKKSDYEAHDAKVCINTGQILNDSSRENPYKQEQYFKSAKEMHEIFEQFPEALSNSLEIAKQCNVNLNPKGYLLPNYPVPKKHDYDSLLRETVEKGLNNFLSKKIIEDKDTYLTRINYELEQISTMGFSSYFLIVYDFIQWAKDNEIPVGPGRGSGAGSLVAFALGITAIDPIKYGLVFERFLNPERISMPDFDIDFCMEKRSEVINYVTEKYGSEAVTQIVTFGTMGARGVIWDVARVTDRSLNLAKRLADLVPSDPGMTLAQAKKQQPLLVDEINRSQDVKDIFDLCHELEGVVRNVGKHAGGIVIAPGNISDYSPIYYDPNSKSSMTQFDKDDAEKIGLIKFDFLGLRTLTVIDKALKSINKMLAEKNMEQLSIDDIPLNDPKVFELISSGKTTAVFQLESSQMKEIIRQLRPSSFEEVIALQALVRPGALKHKVHEKFARRKKGEAFNYPHKLLEPILKETFGELLYQEQVMETARVLAKYSLGQADLLRKAIGKKDEKIMTSQEQEFIEGCKRNKINEYLAKDIFSKIQSFAEYGFNKSHSTAYALLSYQTAYLKTYFPAYYMAAVLASNASDTDRIKELIKDCRDFDIKILKPDINLSYENFTVIDDNEIAYGLKSLKGVADSFAVEMEHIGLTTKFHDLLDFSKKVDTRLGGKRSLDSMAKAGVFDNICSSRAVAIECIQDILSEAKDSSASYGVQESLFDDFVQANDPYANFDDVKELNKLQKLMYEKEAIGFFMTGHPVEDYYRNDFSFLETHTINDLKPDTKKATILGHIDDIWFPKFRDTDSVYINFDDSLQNHLDVNQVNGIVHKDIYQSKRDFFKKGQVLVFSGNILIDEKKTKDFGRTMFSMRVRDVNTPQEAFSKNSKSIYILCDSSPNGLAFVQEKLSSIDNNFWVNGTSQIKLQIKNENVETSIRLDDKFKINISPNSLSYIKELFGEENILIK